MVKPRFIWLQVHRYDHLTVLHTYHVVDASRTLLVLTEYRTLNPSCIYGPWNGCHHQKACTERSQDSLYCENFTKTFVPQILLWPHRHFTALSQSIHIFICPTVHPSIHLTFPFICAHRYEIMTPSLYVSKKCFENLHRQRTESNLTPYQKGLASSCEAGQWILWKDLLTFKTLVFCCLFWAWLSPLGIMWHV